MVYAASLSSPAFFDAALYGLSNASQSVSTAVAQLSSGNRLVTAGTDVAALSISSLLQSQVSQLKIAQTNAAQGNSFLQVAAGGLTQIQSLLNTMQSVATQANSASLTTLQRASLQQQFAGALAQINSIATSTNFNSINLLDGTVSGSSTAVTNTNNATQASAQLTFTDLSGVETVKLNGVTFTGGTDFSTAGGTNAAVTNLATALNNSTNPLISQATYSSNGSGVLTITQKPGGSLGNQYVVNQGGSSSTFTNTGTLTSTAGIYTLAGGVDNGLNISSVTGTGTIGDALVNTQAQTPASVTFTATGQLSDGDTLQIDNGNGGYATFTFKNSASGANQIQIGSTIQATLQNAIATLSQYTSNDNYGVRQLNVALSGSTLTFTSKTAGNPTEFDGATALKIAASSATASVSAATFSNGVNTGVNTSGVTNAGFAGTLNGFTATYVSANKVTASVTIGSKLYTATIANTTPGANTFVRFSSSSGGYFDVQLAAAGQAVANQTDANTYASHLNAAFSTLTFYQRQGVSSFSGVNGLAGASAQLQLNNFANPQVQSVTVTAPATLGGDAVIDVTVAGQDFRSASGIGSNIGKYQTITLTSTTDSNQKIILTNGTTANDLSTTTAAATFQSSLRSSFGLNPAGNGVNFQVGEVPTNTINVTIGNLQTSKLFNGTTPDVSTQSDAAAAQATITTAQNTVNTIVANVGSLQTSFNSALSNLQSESINVDQARSNLADTDIPSTSTQYALSALTANAATAVLAQTLQLQSSLLQVLHRAGA